MAWEMSDTTGQLRAELNRLVLHRIRVALGFGLVAVVAYTITNHLWPETPPWTDTMNLIITVLIGIAYAGTKLPVLERHPAPYALLIFALGSGMRAVGGVWHGDVAPTALMLLALALVTAATLPWGVLAQAVFALVAGAAIAINAALVGNFGPPPGHAAATVLVGLLVSVLLAVELQRHRVQMLLDTLRRQRAEERLAELNRELERRVDERTAQLAAVTQGLEGEARERLRAVHELRASEKRLQDILDNAAAAIQVKDLEGRYQLVNRYWEEAFGRQRNVVVGKTPHEIFPPEVAEAVLANDRRVLAARQPLQAEERLPHLDGARTYLSVKFPLFDSDGTPVGVCGIATDITARTDMEAELRRSEAALSAVVENTTDAIWSIDTRGRITVMNDEARQRFAKRFGASFGSPGVTERVSASLSDEFRGFYARALAGEHVQIERAFDEPDGVRHYLTSLHPIVDNGVVTGATAFSKDITEHKHAEEQARRHQAELAHVLRLGTMGEMAAGLAHEINQPLGAIANYAQGCVRRLRDGTMDAPALLPIVEAIAHEALRAGEIIRRLRGLLRKEDARLQPADVNRLVRESARVVEAEARQHGIALQLDLAVGLPPVSCNDIQIEQVLLNLLLNGVDAVRAASNGDRRVRVATALAADGGIEVTVRDGGIGLPEPPADVFAPFFSTKPDGLGMGLSISRSIVEAHGGRLWATPNPDRGSTFHFTLPRAEQAETDSPQRSQRDAKEALRSA